MPEVAKTERIEAPAARVWELVGPFDGLAAWLPPVAASRTEGEGVGAVRTLTTRDGGIVKERLDAFDPEGMSYTYSMVEMGPMPLARYQATLSVQPDGDGACTMSWVGRFESQGAPEADVVAAIGALYDSGIGRVREILAGQR